VPDAPFQLPDLSQPRKYEHRKPRRPPHLAKRLIPPPERSAPPDLSLFLYAGVVLLVILAVLAVPYLIGYFFEIVQL
jgi:hypothetical protein